MESFTSTPPRQLSLLSKLSILCGGFFSQFGWAFFGFGMIFFWVFVMSSEWVYTFSFGFWEENTGKIVSVNTTNFSENDQTVYEYTYAYQVDGNKYSGKGYSTGAHFSPDQEVAILYRPGSPSVSRMEFARRAPFGRMVIFVVIFPLVGLGFILFSFRQNMKYLDLLIYGRFARGKLLHKNPTNTTINNARVYSYTFEFEAEDGKTYKAIGKTHYTHLLEDEETERILYAHKDPSYSALYDIIPFAPKIARDGGLLPVHELNAWVLVLPGLTLFGNVAAVLSRYVF